ncbi:MAG TPA: YCF48-related protein [Candidatus Dormibacteraeota bacterium]|nr:YCF48-related protein [Candidatus Dormibacteraeota bacterium]
MAAALTVIVVASVLYLRANAPSPRVILQGAPPVPELASKYTTRYEFVSPEVGWAAVAQYLDQQRFWIFRTTDGARHWEKRFSGATQQGAPLLLQFFDRDRGFVLLDRVYRTTDGGSHWDVISVPDQAPDFGFVDPDRGWALDLGHVYSTVDGGMTWRTAGIVPGPADYGGKGGLMSLNFRPDGEGWIGATAESPLVYKTIDGGASWTAVQLPPLPSGQPTGKGFPSATPMFHTSVLLSPGNGVVAFDYGDFGDGQAYVSFDAGRTWRPITAPTDRWFSDGLSFVDARHWWWASSGSLFTTSDAGQSWTYVVTTSPDQMSDWGLGLATPIDARHGWCVTTAPGRTAGSGLAMSSDGGRHWSPANVPKPG